MKRDKNCYLRIINKNNITAAIEDYFKAHRKDPSAKYVCENSEYFADVLIGKIENGYEAEPYRTFILNEHSENRKMSSKKKRTISVPTISDAIVQYACMREMYPRIISNLIEHTYCSLKGRGMEQCVEHFFRQIRRMRKNGNVYCLETDIVKFFENIDHDILVEKTEKLFDHRTTDLVRRLIKPMHGLSIGAPISNPLSAIFLSEFDHFAQEKLKTPYFRYGDDMRFLSNDKETLEGVVVSLNSYLCEHGLSLKPTWRIRDLSKYKTQFCGRMISEKGVMLTTSIKNNIKKAAHRFCKNQNNCTFASLMAYKGHLMHSNSINFIKKLEDTYGIKKRLQKYHSSAN